MEFVNKARQLFYLPGPSTVTYDFLYLVLMRNLD